MLRATRCPDGPHNPLGAAPLNPDAADHLVKWRPPS